jgi:hypothetical protein
MRASLVVILACVVGCGTVAAPGRFSTGCITVVTTRDTTELYRNGKRVLDDDLEAATEESPAAHTLAVRAKSHRWFAVGSFVLGSAMLAPGLGLTIYGAAEKQAGAGATGAVLTLTGLGGVIAGTLLLERARAEAGQAIEVYDQERGNCRR